MPESSRDLFQCLPQFVCSCRQGLRADRAGSIDGSPRQPGFDDQDADGRQDQPPPELLAAFQLGVVHLPKLLAVDVLPGMVRQPAAELLERLDVQRRGLALQGIEIHGERRRARRRVDRVDAGLVGLVEERGSGERSSRTAPSGLWTTMLLPASSATGSGTRSPTRVVGRARTAAGSRDSSSADISGTNFDDRASWLSAGCQPLASTTSLPFADELLDDGGIAVLEPGQHARVAQPIGVDAPILPEADLGEIVELGAGQRGEQRMVEGDLAEHHVARRPPLRRCSRAATPARPASVSARPGAVAT